ncbi:MAG TPA: protein kinase [Ilumatobacteraceae bacterium]|nr:protein kinase [Ilumatobacteraceae bacterium]
MTRRLAGRYVLGDQLGAGGTSRVHAAIDERLNRRVAVKLLDARVVAADPVGRERFLREGQTTAGFSHRHAVTVFDAGEDDGDLFIVMELVEGPSLAEYLHRTGPLPVDETVRLARVRARCGSMIERRGVKQREAAEDLRVELAVWADSGDIPPAIALTLDDLLAPLV